MEAVVGPAVPPAEDILLFVYPRVMIGIAKGTTPDVLHADCMARRVGIEANMRRLVALCFDRSIFGWL